MKYLATLLLVCVLVGCACGPRYETYTAQGTVRNVWVKGSETDVTFEHDNGDIVVFHLTGSDGDVPPMWAGMHCVLTYERFVENGDYKIISVRRTQ